MWGASEFHAAIACFLARSGRKVTGDSRRRGRLVVREGAALAQVNGRGRRAHGCSAPARLYRFERSASVLPRSDQQFFHLLRRDGGNHHRLERNTRRAQTLECDPEVAAPYVGRNIMRGVDDRAHH